MNTRESLLTIALVICATLASGCASSIPAAPKDQRAPSDPWEPMNRRISAFNDNVDRFTFKPLAKGYERILPSTMRRGINNFSENLFSPLYIINNFLQGKFKRGFSETWRFTANTIWGIGGFVDVGADLGLNSYREDFGQTLAVWGVPEGPYVVVPILGPRTLRHATMIPLNIATDLGYYVDDKATRQSIYVVRLVDLRAQFFSAEALIEDSFDRYLTIRESYLQNRLYQIFDGNPPEDDDFYDEFEDDFKDDPEQ
jgi:phospholipid-binding lipoprotein MlaA